MIKNWIKKIIPTVILKKLRPFYHGLMAVMASYYYGRPSEKMFMIGVTGTAGKSTTVAMLAQILNYAGKKTGYMTTVNFFDGEKDYINKHGLSMPGGPKLQRQLYEMFKKGCQYAIVECTSEGLAQNRHFGISFNATLFTNLSSAHIETHGSFENYRNAKIKLFKGVRGNKKEASRIVGVNLDDENAEYFLGSEAEQKFGVSFHQQKSTQVQKIYNATRTEDGFEIESQKFAIKLPGEFNKYNALLAVACANMLGVGLETVARGIASFVGILGRMEFVENDRGIKICVDYGCEPASFRAALEAASQIPHKKLIHVFGSTGGHRDISKRFDFGQISAKYADQIIITNDDVYDSNPEEIAANIESGVRSQELWKGQYEIILDRKEAIRKALFIAQKDDLVLITGKGSEQFLVLPGNKRIVWDEVSEVKKFL